MLIDGKLTGSKNGLLIKNPYTGKSVGFVPVTSRDDVQRALKLASTTRCSLSVADRIAFLEKVALGIAENTEEFARCITDETGLSLKDARHEVTRAIATAEISAWATREIMEAHDRSHPYRVQLYLREPRSPLLHVMAKPARLVVSITPFNHPFNLICHDVFPAIGAGTPIVLKPSPKTPLTALMFGEMLHKLGLPPNMLNIVVDDGRNTANVVEQLVTFPETELVLFTGSVPTGFSVARLIAKRENPLVRYIPECGGLSPFIICEDADLKLAADLAVKGCFAHSGQRCTAIRKLIPVGAITDEFMERFATKTEELQFGDPYDEKTDMGTVISEVAAINIRYRIDIALKRGATFRLGHKDFPDHPALIAPTILDYVDPEAPLVLAETFGPVAPIIRAKTFSEALEFAKSPYKLAGAIVTKSVTAARMAAEELGVGQFSWNGIPGYRTEAAPFGGFGWSGNGAKRGVVETMEAMLNKRTFYEHYTKGR